MRHSSSKHEENAEIMMLKNAEEETDENSIGFQ